MMRLSDAVFCMARPQIRPTTFVGLQNGVAAAIAACLLLTELSRRLLYAYPESETLWWLTILSNRTVMPLLQLMEDHLGNPDWLVPALLAAVAVSLLSWGTRYWFGTALSGHMALAALVVVTLSIFSRGRVLYGYSAPSELLGPINLPLLGIALGLLSLSVLIMCIADHVAFFRYIHHLVSRLRRRG